MRSSASSNSCPLSSKMKFLAIFRLVYVFFLLSLLSPSAFAACVDGVDCSCSNSLCVCMENFIQSPEVCCVGSAETTCDACPIRTTSESGDSFCVYPSPTSSPTPTPTISASVTPTISASDTHTISSSSSPTISASVTPTISSSSSPTISASVSPTISSSSSPTISSSS